MGQKRRMRFGYMPDANFGHFDMPTPTPAHTNACLMQMVEEAQLAEAVGFHGVFLPDRHMRTETVGPDPLTILAALATATQRVDLGTYVLIQSLYDPMAVAERTALIDNLSGGRLILGVGQGYNELYWRMFGLRSEHRLSRFIEGLDVLKKAWTSTEPFTFVGEHFEYHDVFLSPLPFQRDPHPRIWGGAIAEGAIRRAGTYASGFAAGVTVHELDVWREQVGLFLEGANEAGITEPEMAMMRNGFCAETRQEATASFGEAFLDEVRYTFDRGLPHPIIETRSDIALSALSPALVIGTPDDCAEQLHRLESEFNVDYVVLRFRVTAGPDRQSTLRAIRLFGEEVIPRFR